MSTIDWNLADFVAFQFPAVRRWISNRLARSATGRRCEGTCCESSDDDLRSKLREQGISALSEVEAAYMESDGEISILKRKNDEKGNPADKTKARP